jgi:hypothetical protein
VTSRANVSDVSAWRHLCYGTDSTLSVGDFMINGHDDAEVRGFAADRSSGEAAQNEAEQSRRRAEEAREVRDHHREARDRSERSFAAPRRRRASPARRHGPRPRRRAPPARKPAVRLTLNGKAWSMPCAPQPRR